MRSRAAVSIAVVVAAFVLTGYVVTRFDAREPTIPSADFRNAAAAEIRDEQGAIVLRGTFRLEKEEDDDIERKAALTDPTGAEVKGEAEIEFATEFPVEQEVEFAARGLSPGGTYTLLVDGRTLAAATADERGRIAVELDVPLPRMPSAR